MKPAELFILKQEEPFKSMLLHLQMHIERSFPDARLKYKWRLPVYYIQEKPFCYLNVSHKKGFVDLGFWASAHLKDNKHLVTDGRKVVKSLRYFSLEEIDQKILDSVLQEAYQSKGKGFYQKKNL